MGADLLACVCVFFSVFIYFFFFFSFWPKSVAHGALDLNLFLFQFSVFSFRFSLFVFGLCDLWSGDWAYRLRLNVPAAFSRILRKCAFNSKLVSCAEHREKKKIKINERKKEENLIYCRVESIRTVCGVFLSEMD